MWENRLFGDTIFSAHSPIIKPIKADTKLGQFMNQPCSSHICFWLSVLFSLSVSLSLSPPPHPALFPSLPINEAADIPDLLSQLLQDLFFVTNLQQLESRGMHVNFVCVIWWQVRLNQAPSGWMRGAQGSGIWGAEWWTGSGQGWRHKALFMCINMLYSSRQPAVSQLHPQST